MLNNKHKPQTFCKANRCGIAVGADRFMCQRHWSLVPTSIRFRLLEAYRPGQTIEDASDNWLEAAAEAVERIAQAELVPVANQFRRLQGLRLANRAGVATGREDRP